MYCPKCRKNVKEGADYCPECGGRLIREEDFKTEGKGNSKLKKIFIIIGIILLVVAIGAICIWMFVLKDNQQVKNKLTERISQRDKSQVISNTADDSKESEPDGTEKSESKNVIKKKITIEHISDARTYKDGLAFILFDTGEKQYKGFIDEEGTLKFYVPMDQNSSDEVIYAYEVDFDNGYTWFEYSNTFYVIDQNGRIKSKYDSEQVVSYGAGYTWTVSEEDEAWNDAGIHKYVLHAPSGEEVTSYSIENEYMDQDRFSIAYIGEGVFAYETMDTDQEMEEPEKVCMIYDVTVGKTEKAEIGFEAIRDAGISDGLIVNADTEDGNWPNVDNPIILTLIKDGEIKEAQISGGDIDGAESYPLLLGWSEKYVLFTVEIDEKSQLWIYDLEKASIKKYTGAYMEYVTDYRGAEGNIYKNVIVAKINGADGKDYICMINADTMEDIGEPILTKNFKEFYLEQGVLEIDTEDGTAIYSLQNEKQTSFEDYFEIMDIGDDVLTVKNKESEGKFVAWKHWDGTTLFDEIETSTSKELTKAKVMK